MIAPSELTTHAERARLRAAILSLVDRAANDPDRALDDARDALLADLARFHAAHVTPFARLCAARGARFDRDPDAWPALPTDVYRHARVSVFVPGADARTFLTSGTTQGARGAHPFLDLAVYDRVALVGARFAFLPDGAFDLLVLAADPTRQPESSLGHMLGLFADEARTRAHDAHVAFVLDGDRLDTEAIERAVTRSIERDRALVVCGTSFAFVFAEDVLTSRFALPSGSRVMFTGGFKGRSRELDEPTLRALIEARWGVGRDRVVTEYGMTELSSQLWSREGIDRGSPSEQGVLWIPPWVRVTAVDPVTLAPVREGSRGILRFDDLANLDSCVSIQTADYGVIVRRARDTRGVRLLGRDPSAVPRGCSLAIEEALASR
jgi:hypothetical protein